MVARASTWEEESKGSRIQWHLQISGFCSPNPNRVESGFAIVLRWNPVPFPSLLLPGCLQLETELFLHKQERERLSHSDCGRNTVVHNLWTPFHLGQLTVLNCGNGLVCAGKQSAHVLS